MKSRAGIHFGTNWTRILAAVKCSPANAASDAATNTGPRATILNRAPEDAVSRSHRYVHIPAAKNPSPSADGQKVAGDTTAPRSCARIYATQGEKVYVQLANSTFRWSP